MIKVNVLSFQRRSKRQQNRGFSGQASLFIGATLTVLAILGLWSMALHDEYKALLTEKEVKVAELAELKEKFEGTEILESTYKALLTRARLLEHQSGRKFVPVSLMDSISRSLTPLSLWLLRVGVDGKNVEIEGRGLQSEDILRFVDTLEQTLLWENLLAIEMQKESYQSIPVYRFTLRFTLNLETAVGSQKSAQALDAPGKIKEASSPQR
jgi:type IV pilus assembly protein PilN